jgi:hypothetical protein
VSPDNHEGAVAKITFKILDVYFFNDRASDDFS